MLVDRPILYNNVSDEALSPPASSLVPVPALPPSLLDSFCSETPRHYNEVLHSTVCAITDATVMLKSGLKRAVASINLDCAACPRKGGFQNKKVRSNRRRIVEDDTSSESSREENKENHNDEDVIRANGARDDGPSLPRQMPPAAQRASAIDNGKKRLMCYVACVVWSGVE